MIKALGNVHSLVISSDPNILLCLILLLRGALFSLKQSKNHLNAHFSRPTLVSCLNDAPLQLQQDMPYQKIIVLLTLFFSSYSYLLTQNSYFYLNSSYSKQVISFTVCFHVDLPASLTFKSDVLVPQGNHQTSARFNQEKGLVFDQPYDSDIIGFNNYDLGQYWFGVKIQYENPEKKQFVPLSMDLTIGQSTLSYQFLVPLFTFPLNAIEIAPVNRLRVCGGQFLVSSHLAYGQFDMTALSPKEITSLEVKEEKDWGYFKEDVNGNYLRFKSKKTSEVTLNGKGNNFQVTCTVNEGVNSASFQGESPAYTIKQLMSISPSIDNEILQL